MKVVATVDIVNRAVHQMVDADQLKIGREATGGGHLKQGLRLQATLISLAKTYILIVRQQIV